jgi:4-aminobutyrate aminotransferase/(S)-3-amino-2-methylpropionate transaminase
MERDQLNARAQHIGERVVAKLKALQERFPHSIGDIRGLGAMIGVELIIDGDRHRPATELTAHVLKACVSRGLIVLGAGVHGNVIRFLAPLVITDEQLDRGLEILCDETAIAIDTTQNPKTILSQANSI